MAKARAARHPRFSEHSDTPPKNDSPEPNGDISEISHHTEADDILDDDILETEAKEDSWDGGVYVPDSEEEFVPLGLAEDSSDEESLVEFDGDELVQHLHKPTAYGQLCDNYISKTQWKKAEANRSLGYTGNSTRTRERGRKQARERQEFREHAKTS